MSATKKLAIIVALLAVVFGASYGGAVLGFKSSVDSRIAPMTMVIPGQGAPYVVPLGMNLFITNIHNGTPDAELYVDDVSIAKGFFNDGNHVNALALAQPIIVAEGQQVWSNKDGAILANAYLTNNVLAATEYSAEKVAPTLEPTRLPDTTTATRTGLRPVPRLTLPPAGPGIPSGTYVSDGYLGSRRIEIEGLRLRMYCQGKTGGSLAGFPQLGWHTYEYRLYIGRDPGGSANLSEVDRIHLRDVVNGNGYEESFQYMTDHEIMVIQEDSYRIR